MDKSRNSVEARRLCRKGIALIFPASISNRKDGFQLLRKAAALGSIDAHEWLGAAYHYGLGTRVNRSLAFKHDLITAKAGRANGEYHVGIAYDTGSGVRANQKHAIKWLRRAAKHDKYSMNVLRQVLGKAYRCGWGVKKNVKKGFAMQLIAARRGIIEAQFSVGYCFSKGLGVRSDPAKAFQWYLRAAKKGHDDAAYNVGYYYSKGRSVQRNLHKANYWFARVKVLRKRLERG